MRAYIVIIVGIAAEYAAMNNPAGGPGHDGIIVGIADANTAMSNPAGGPGHDGDEGLHTRRRNIVHSRSFGINLDVWRALQVH